MRKVVPGVLLLLLLQTGCIWKLWSKEKPVEEKVFDLYGTVQTVADDKIEVETKEGVLEFAIMDSSIKGSDFQPGAYVHVYYKMKGEAREVTMVVEKVDY